MLTFRMLAAICATASVSYAQAPIQALFTNANYDLPAGPFEVAAGDLNGDTLPDVAVSLLESGHLGILMNRGNGGFRRGTFKALPNAGPRDVALADLNSDGKLDAVVVCASIKQIAVYAGDGTGEFASPAFETTVGLPIAVDTADLNNGGVLEVVVAHYGDPVWKSYIGNGTGGFTVAYLSACSGIATDLALADFSGDGFVDIATSTTLFTLGSGVDIGFNNTLGVFVDPIHYFPLVSPASGSVWVSKGDMNSDGAVDILMSGGQLFKNGSGVFTQQSFPYVLPTDGTLADVNHDTNLDAVLHHGNRLLVYLGSATGVFASTSIDIPAGSGVGSLLVTDVNGDSHPDYVATHITDPSVSVRFGDGAGSYLHPAIQSPTMSNTFSRQMDTRDLNLDGLPDLVVVNEALGSSGNISVFLTLPGGGFAPAVNYTSVSNPEAAAIGDFNGDQLLDLFVVHCYGIVTVWPAIAPGVFGAPQIQNHILAGTCMQAVVAGDLNHDGLDDVVVGNDINDVRVLHATGGGAFTTAQTFSMTLTLSNIGDPLTIGDLNLDGNPDVVAAHNANFGPLLVFLGNANGMFNNPVSYGTNGLPMTVLIRDANHDGFPDVVYAESGGVRRVSYRPGNGTGVLGAHVGLVLFDNEIPSGLASLDANEDGRLDLVMSTGNTTSAQILLGAGDGTFTFEHAIFGGLNISRNVAAGDFSGDGLDDVVLPQEQSGQIAIFNNLTFLDPPHVTKYGVGTPGCAGGAHRFHSDQPVIVGNSNYKLYCTHAPPNSLGLGLIANVPLASPGNDTFGLGFLLLLDLINSTEVIALDIFSDPYGFCVISGPVPNNPMLIGQVFYSQAIWYDQLCNSSPTGFTSSNALAKTVQAAVR